LIAHILQATSGGCRAKQSLDKPELRVVILCDYHDKTFAVWTASPQMPIFLLETARAAARERQIIAWSHAEPEGDVALVDCGGGSNEDDAVPNIVVLADLRSSESSG
jgi:hypothetical protein